MLQTGDGDPSHLRALFGDVDLHTLDRLAAEFAVDHRTLARSYARARQEVAARIRNSTNLRLSSIFDLRGYEGLTTAFYVESEFPGAEHIVGSRRNGL
jgi:hypothetical protein